MYLIGKKKTGTKWLDFLLVTNINCRKIFFAQIFFRRLGFLTVFFFFFFFLLTRNYNDLNIFTEHKS